MKIFGKIGFTYLITDHFTKKMGHQAVTTVKPIVYIRSVVWGSKNKINNSLLSYSMTDERIKYLQWEVRGVKILCVN